MAVVTIFMTALPLCMQKQNILLPQKASHILGLSFRSMVSTASVNFSTKCPNPLRCFCY